MGQVATVLAVAIEAETARRLARAQKAATRARATASEATRRRDEAVVAAAAAGANLREIAEALDISKVAVKKILDRALDAKKPPLP